MTYGRADVCKSTCHIVEMPDGIRKEERMKRIFLSVVPLLFVVALFMLPVAVSAKTSRPNVRDCKSFNCFAHLEWIGDTHGDHTNVDISNPTMNESDDYWHRYDIMESTSFAYIQYGIERDMSSSAAGLCASHGNNLYFFSTVQDSLGNTYPGAPFCHIISQTSPAINNLLDIKAGFFTSGGGGMFVQFKSADGSINKTDSFNESVDSHIDQTYANITRWESAHAIWSGELVWGVQWIDNQFQHPTLNTWIYQTSPQNNNGVCSGNGCPTVDNPTQMYWNVYPHDNSTGGQLYSCEYEGGLTCTLGH